MSKDKKNKHITFGLSIIYFLGFAISLADAITSYTQSSYLEQFFSVSAIGVLMSIAAAITFVASLTYLKLIEKLGNHPTALLTAFVAIVTSLALTFLRDTPAIYLTFIIRYVCLILILINFDIFLENKSLDKTTGSTRSKYLTAINLACLISPLLMSKLVGKSNYIQTFNFSFWCLVILIAVILIFSKFLNSQKKFISQKLNIKKTITHIIASKNLSKIFLSTLVLQIFYSIAVIYVPIKLHSELGMSWEVIGIAFTVMLLPFIIFQYPAGLLADKYLGEKEILITGNLILIFGCLLIALSTSTSPAIWAIILFVGRTGAALSESMQEVYFYKKIDASEVGLITMFRQTRSVGWLCGALIASIFLNLITISSLFYIVAAIIFFNILNLKSLKDTL